MFFSLCCVKRDSRFHLSEYLIGGRETRSGPRNRAFPSSAALSACPQSQPCPDLPRPLAALGEATFPAPHPAPRPSAVVVGRVPWQPSPVPQVHRMKADGS